MSARKDRILIWIGAELVHYFLAYSLQQKYDADYYAIIDITNKPKDFFKNQSLVIFKKIWFFHDEINTYDKKNPDLQYLQNFEKRFEIDLWKLAINERIFYRFFNFHKFSAKEILTIEEKSAKFFESIVSDVKPDFFITKQPSFHHLELFKEMCKKSGCKILMLSYPKLGFRMLLSEDVNVMDDAKEITSVVAKNRSFPQMMEYLETHSSHSQLKNYYTAKKSKVPQVKALFDYILSSNENIKTNYNYYGRTKNKVLLNLLRTRVQKRNRERFMQSHLLQKIDLSEPFIYFPMATDLERHLLIDSPFFTNQIEVIRSVAKSIPVGFHLYVKENPSNITRDWRPIDQYKELLDIPNVKLIHPSFSNQELLSNCSLVISIAGSSSFEAAFYQKPSIVFGNVLYSLLPSVHKVDKLEDLPKLIRGCLNQKPRQEDLDKFLTLLENNTFEFNMVDFVSLISNRFYNEESSVDVRINEGEIKEFYEEYADLIEILSSKHIEKINAHKSHKYNT